MRRLVLSGIIAALLALTAAPTANAEPDAPHIEWEVKNRFRLFRSEADFRRHIDARGDSILAAEQLLARASDGRGWARDTVERLCTDRGGRLLEVCERDGQRESYLSPRDHRVGVTLEGVLPPFESCVWSFDDGDGPARTVKTDCIEEVKLRVPYGKPTRAAVDILLRDGTTQQVTTEIQVRDVLIAGMGDSIAAGDGNPDRRDPAVGRRLLLPPAVRRRIFPARPCRLHRQPLLQHGNRARTPAPRNGCGRARAG